MGSRSKAHKPKGRNLFRTLLTAKMRRNQRLKRDNEEKERKIEEAKEQLRVEEEKHRQVCLLVEEEKRELARREAANLAEQKKTKNIKKVKLANKRTWTEKG